MDKKTKINEEITFDKDAIVDARLMDKQVWVTSRIVPNGDHCEACWEEQIPVFMHVLQYYRE